MLHLIRVVANRNRHAKISLFQHAHSHSAQQEWVAMDFTGNVYKLFTWWMGIGIGCKQVWQDLHCYYSLQKSYKLSREQKFKKASEHGAWKQKTIKFREIWEFTRDQRKITLGAGSRNMMEIFVKGAMIIRPLCRGLFYTVRHRAAPVVLIPK